jgi:hypothetical protein
MTFSIASSPIRRAADTGTGPNPGISLPPHHRVVVDHHVDHVLRPGRPRAVVGPEQVEERVDPVGLITFEPAAPDAVLHDVVGPAVDGVHHLGQRIRCHGGAQVADLVAVVFIDDDRRLDPPAFLPEPSEGQLPGRLDQLALHLRCLRGHIDDLDGLGHGQLPAPEGVGHHRSASCPAISTASMAGPTAVPVLAAIHAATDRNPSPRHTAAPSSLAAVITRSAASTRSASAHCSTTRAAAGTSSPSMSTPQTTRWINPSSSSSGSRPQRRTYVESTDRL